jgi:hypothetical protein
LPPPHPPLCPPTPAGWAIEGAIGSEHKIDASYLSPHVNMAARLEAATKQFGATILLSDDFVRMLSPGVRCAGAAAEAGGRPAMVPRRWLGLDSGAGAQQGRGRGGGTLRSTQVAMGGAFWCRRP